MEEVELTLKEDVREVSEELTVDVFDLGLTLLFASLTHEMVDDATGSVSIGPLVHEEGKLELLLSQL